VTARRSSAWREVAAFVPMCALAAVSWAELLAGPPAWRIAALVGLATGCGLVLALSARLEPDGRTEARIVRIATVAVALIAGPVVVGVPPALLAPTGWEDLAAGLASGVDGLPQNWPYAGGDAWVRRTVLLAIPIMTIPAAAFALSPPAAGPGGPEAAAVRRVGALLLLLSLIGFAGSERTLSDPTARGALLLVALAAWLFLPRLQARPTAALAAVAAVIVAGVASLPLAAALSPEPRQARAQAANAPPARARPDEDRSQRSRSRPERRRSSERPRRSQRRDESRRRNASQREVGSGRDRSGDSERKRQGPSAPREGAGGLSPVLLVLLAVAAAALGLYVLQRRRARARAGRDEADELRRILERLGWSVPPETTLAELEHDLAAWGGPAAAGYARGLRERRFGAASPAVRLLDRRALRQALTSGHGARVRLRGLVALPPAALDLRR
jgi:hypothetical protein